MLGARGKALRLSRGSRIEIRLSGRGRIGSGRLSLLLSLSRGVFLLELLELFNDIVITLDEDF